MSDKTPDFEIIALAVKYNSLSPDQKRDFSEEILKGRSNGKPDLDNLATWADIDGILGPIAWAWRPWLPLGMLTILAGESGSGKSALALRISGCFLRGDPWPDKSKFDGKTGSVLWCEAEAAQAVNLERAKKWGLPLEKIYSPLDKPLEDLRLDDPSHKGALAEKAFLSDVRLIIIDSLRGANTRDENSSETMGLVKWLAELARDSGKPILLTHHLRKRGIFDASGIDLERLRGSSAIVQAARLVWALDVPDPQAKNWKRLQVVKSNLARFPEPVGMMIDNQGVHFGLAPEEPRIEGASDRAVDLLMAILGNEPQPYQTVKDEFDSAGISIATMKRAKAKLGIVSLRPEGKSNWYWSLPAKGKEYEN